VLVVAAVPTGLVMTWPAGEITYHWPPTPCPFAIPGAVSEAYVCSGQPAYVTMVPPEGSATVPTRFGCTTEVVAGFAPEADTMGGHVVAHPPVHTTFPPFSGVNTYRVRPCALVRTDPMLENLCVDSLNPPPCEWAVPDAGERAVDVVGVFDAELLPHAAATKASGTTNRAEDRTRGSFTRMLTTWRGHDVLPWRGGPANGCANRLTRYLRGR
jgi:hypothetical protein